MTDSEVQQLIVWVGTQAKIDEARQQGTIGPDDFVVVTDAPDLQEKLTSANAGTGISITEVGGVVKISNTQTSAEWGNILGNLPDQADLWAYLSDILGDITDIQNLIPAQASSSNQLADKEFVNSSISTNTANFIGTFESVSDLESYSGDVTNNDYAFVINGVVTDSGNDWATFNALNAYDKTLLTNFDYAWVINGINFDLYRFDIVNQVWELRAEDIEKDSVSLNTAYNRYKATVSGSTLSWEYEYTLNNSSFTAAQWEAINSGATEAKVNQITTNQNAIGTLSNLTTTEKNNLVGAINEVKSSKQDTISDLATIRAGAAAGATALQGVQLGGTDLTPDTDKKVNIPYGTNAAAGVAKAGAGLASMSGGTFYIYPATDAAIGAKTNNANPIVPKNLDKAVMEGLGDNSLTWTDAYKTSACKTIGTISGVQINSTDLTPDTTTNKVNIPYATNDSLGVVRGNQSFGTYMSNGTMCTWKATDSELVSKIQNYKPIVPGNLNVAIREGLGNNSLTWTETYKASARNTIGAEAQATIQTLSATDSITLADNTIYNGSEQTALTIALPATVDVSFLCEICFSSGSTATTLTYPQSGINWAGDDVSSNVFTPVASKRYTIICSYDGSNYLFVVKGV